MLNGAYSIICLVCLIIQVFILMENERYKGLDGKEHKFRWYLVVSVLAFGIDLLWGLVLGIGEIDTVTFSIFSALNYALAGTTSYMWCMYGISRNITLKKDSRRKLASFLLTLPIMVMVCSLLYKLSEDIVSPVDIQNNLFRGPRYYEYTIYITNTIYIIVNFVVLLYAFIRSKKTSEKIKTTFAFFIIIPICFNIFQTFLWDQPWTTVGHMLASFMIFMTDVIESREQNLIAEKTKNFENRIKSVEELAMVRAVKFKDVMLSSAEIYVEANLTKNKIISKPYMLDENGKNVLMDIPQLGDDYGYNEFELWCAANKLLSNKTEFLVKNNCNYLIDAYNNGEELIEVQATYKKFDDRIIEVKHSCYLYKDEESGDILALVIVNDISEELLLRRNRKRQENALRDSIRVMYEEKNSEEAVKNLLGIVADYYGAIRACIFEMDKNKTAVSNTYEWNKAGISSEIDNLKRVPIESLNSWFEAFETMGVYSVDSVDDDIDNCSVAYNMLKSQGVTNFIAVPIIQEGEICGFVGVENARFAMDDVVVLKMAALLSFGEILRRKQSDEEHITLNKLADSMVFLGLADLISDYMHVYGIADEYRDRYVDAEIYSETMGRYVDAEVADSDKRRLRRIADPLFISEQLQIKEVYKINYEAKVGEENRNLSLEFRRADEQGRKVVIIASDNTEAVVFEREAKNAMEAAMKNAEEANAAKTHFLFNMSHDLRTPMNAVIGYTEMAERNLDNKEKLGDCLRKLKMSGNHLLNIINDVLELSRIESGQIEMHPEPTDVEEGKEELESVFVNSITARGLKYSFEHRNIRDRYIRMDRARATQIVFNILSNAIKYTQPGGEVTYVMEQIDDNADGNVVLQFTIHDNGVGMSKEYLSHIFELFSREKTTTESGVEGTGLGMAMVKQLIDRMEGTIHIESEAGEGTTVTCTIPFERCSKEEIENLKNVSQNNISFDGKRVLLVEDNELNSEIVSELLEEMAIEVTTAKDGTIAVDKVKEKGLDYYDLILMDIQMPIMNGYEATKVIRDMYPKSQVPILALSANAFEEDRKKSKAAGMNEHIAKPISADKLREILAKYM